MVIPQNLVLVQAVPNVARCGPGVAAAAPSGPGPPSDPSWVFANNQNRWGDDHNGGYPMVN
jgi:hypothetical protein